MIWGTGSFSGGFAISLHIVDEGVATVRSGVVGERVVDTTGIRFNKEIE